MLGSVYLYPPPFFCVLNELPFPVAGWHFEPCRFGELPTCSMYVHLLVIAVVLHAYSIVIASLSVDPQILRSSKTIYNCSLGFFLVISVHHDTFVASLYAGLCIESYLELIGTCKTACMLLYCVLPSYKEHG